MSILDLGEVVFACIADKIAWFQRKGLLARNKICPACNGAMAMQPRADVTDSYNYFSFKHCII